MWVWPVFALSMVCMVFMSVGMYAWGRRGICCTCMLSFTLYVLNLHHHHHHLLLSSPSPPPIIITITSYCHHHHHHLPSPSSPHIIITSHHHHLPSPSPPTCITAHLWYDGVVHDTLSHDTTEGGSIHWRVSG